MKVATRRVRFRVPELEYLTVKSFVHTQGLSARVWVEVLLTHLCQPRGEHPVVAQQGVSAAAVLRAVRPKVRDEDEAIYEVSLPQSVIRAMDPGLELAELELPSFLAAVWGWSMREDGEVYAPLAARLAAFASYFGGSPAPWDAWLARCAEAGLTVATPHELYMPPEYRVERLPWVVRMQGVAP